MRVTGWVSGARPVSTGSRPETRARHRTVAMSVGTWWATLLIASTGVLAIGAPFVRASWHHLLTFPLDDPYIYFDYARTAAHGMWLQYNPGDKASSGATSVLWLALLAAGYRIGLHGGGLLWWDVALEAACATASVMCLHHTARSGGLGPVSSWVLAFSVLVAGIVLLPLWTGLEVAGTLAAVTGFMALEASGRRRGAAGLAAAMPLVRPDLALAFAIVLPLSWGLRPLWGKAAHGWLPPLAVVGYAAVMAAVTGHPEMNGGAAKLLWLAPGMPVIRLAGLSLFGTVAAMGSVWMTPTAPSGLEALCWCAGGALWVVAARNWRRAGPPASELGREFALLALAGMVVEGAAFGPGAVGYQFGRYLSPLAPLLLMSAAIGMVPAGRRPTATRREGVVARRTTGWPVQSGRTDGAAILPGVFLGAGLLLAFYSVRTMREASREIGAEQVHLGRWIAQTLPPDAVVVVNDAGAMAYYGHRYTIDAIGITTDGFAAAARTPGQPGEWPALRGYLARRGLRGRPVFAVVFPTWLPSLVARGRLLGVFHLGGPHIVDGTTVDIVQLATEPSGTPGAPRPG